MSLDLSKYVLVCDFKTDPHSKVQVDTLKEQNLQIKGIIDCSDEKHIDSEACKKVPVFPTFCNIESNFCVGGLRTTPEDFAKLQQP